MKKAIKFQVILILISLNYYNSFSQEFILNLIQDDIEQIRENYNYSFSLNEYKICNDELILEKIPLSILAIDTVFINSRNEEIERIEIYKIIVRIESQKVSFVENIDVSNLMFFVLKKGTSYFKLFGFGISNIGLNSYSELKIIKGYLEDGEILSRRQSKKWLNQINRGKTLDGFLKCQFLSLFFSDSRSDTVICSYGSVVKVDSTHSL